METSLPTPELPQVKPQSSRFIAPWWHTVILVIFLLGFSALGSSGHPGLDHSLRMKLYISTIVMEWLMVLFIMWGVQRGGTTTLAELVGGKWNTPEDFLLDIAVAFGFWMVAAIVLLAAGFLLG